MRKYVAVYTPKNSDINEEITDIIEAEDRDAGRDLANVKQADLRLQGLKYYAPKVRLFKVDTDSHLLPKEPEQPPIDCGQPEDFTVPEFENVANVTPIGSTLPAVNEDQLSICGSVLGEVPKDPFREQVEALNKRINGLFPGEVLRLEGIPEAVYHAVIGVGSTALKKFVECPAKYKAYIDGLLKVTRNFFDLGSAVHAYILEPNKFQTEFDCLPETVKVRHGKAWDALQAANPGVTYMSLQDYSKAIQMGSKTIMLYSDLFTGGVAEVSYWKRDERTGIILKSRVDYEKGNGLGKLGVDLKTANSSKPSLFSKHCIDYGYYLQDALYTEVAGLQDFLFCVVESEAPFLPTLNAYFDDYERDLARQEMRQALDAMAICMEKDEWPGYSPDYHINAMKIPAWKRQQITGDYQ